VNARQYHHAHETEEIEAMCEDAGTNYAYWRQIAYGHRQPSWQMAQRLAKASGYAMTTRELRPDIHDAMTGENQ